MFLPLLAKLHPDVRGAKYRLTLIHLNREFISLPNGLSVVAWNGPFSTRNFAVCLSNRQVEGALTSRIACVVRVWNAWADTNESSKAHAATLHLRLESADRAARRDSNRAFFTMFYCAFRFSRRHTRTRGRVQLSAPHREHQTPRGTACFLPLILPSWCLPRSPVGRHAHVAYPHVQSSRRDWSVSGPRRSILQSRNPDAVLQNKKAARSGAACRDWKVAHNRIWFAARR